MRNINKLFSLLFVLCVSMFYAQMPSTQPVPPTGTGTTGTGEQSIPVDMYVYALAVLAIMLLVFFAKKYKSQKI